MISCQLFRSGLAFNPSSCIPSFLPTRETWLLIWLVWILNINWVTVTNGLGYCIVYIHDTLLYFHFSCLHIVSKIKHSFLIVISFLLSLSLFPDKWVCQISGFSSPSISCSLQAHLDISTQEFQLWEEGDPKLTMRQSDRLQTRLQRALLYTVYY